MFISYKLHEVLEISDRIVVLRNGKVVAETTPEKTNRRELEKMMVRKEVIEIISTSLPKIGSKVLEVWELSALSDRGYLALKRVNFEVYLGEILGITGVVGNGQRELEDVICRVRKPTEGKVMLDNIEITGKSSKEIINLGIGRIPKDRMEAGLILDISLYENLVVELNSHTTITILPSDRKEEIVRFFNSIPLHVKKRIEEVSIDMRESFRRGIKESLGRDVRIVVDPFHVIRDGCRRIDDERKPIQSTHLCYKGKRIKIPKIIFLKGREKLTDKERDKIDYYFNLYPSLKEFYEVKERLRYMFKYMKHEDIEVIREYINNLIRDMDRSDDPEIRRWSKTLKRWREEIINHFFNFSSTSIVEGYNTLSKLIKRISFGLRDVNTYINKIFSGIMPLNLLPHLLT